MQYWMISIMNHYGYLGIALLILIENLFPPIPSEVILTFGGFLTTYTNMNLIGVILFSTLGSVLGAVVLYQIGSLVPVFKLEAIVEGRLGKLLHFKKRMSLMPWNGSTAKEIIPSFSAGLFQL